MNLSRKLLKQFRKECAIIAKQEKVKLIKPGDLYFKYASSTNWEVKDQDGKVRCGCTACRTMPLNSRVVIRRESI